MTIEDKNVFTVLSFPHNVIRTIDMGLDDESAVECLDAKGPQMFCPQESHVFSRQWLWEDIKKSVADIKILLPTIFLIPLYAVIVLPIRSLQLATQSAMKKLLNSECCLRNRMDAVNTDVRRLRDNPAEEKSCTKKHKAQSSIFISIVERCVWL